MNDQDKARIEPLPPADTPASGQRLEVVSRGPNRAARPVTNLAKVFGQFAEVQHQVTEQVLALEESVGQEREVLAAAVAQLPDIKERINWLISSFYELGQKDVAIEQRISRQDMEISAATSTLSDNQLVLEKRVDVQDAQIAAIAAGVQTLVEGQRRWESTLDQVIELLLRARSAAPALAQSADGSGKTDTAATA